MIHVPLVDLRATYLPIRKQLFESFESIFDDMGLFLGKNVQAFEDEFTRYCGAEFGLGCSSGTDALTLAIRAFDFPRGFEAIIPSHTFFATFESVIHAGGVPVMIDVDPQSYTMNPARLEAAITKKTAVIIPVHLYGQPADMDPILRAGHDHGLRVIEDAAQAHGARYRHRMCGGLADAAAFSFYFTKNLGAFGEAGFVTAADEAIYERMQLLRHHGHASKFDHTLIGYNMRIDELQAAVLRAKLPLLEANNARRREIADHYNAAFADVDLVIPFVPDHSQPNRHCYVVLTERRDEMVHHLTECKIGTGVHYKNPIHLQPALRSVPHRAMPLDVTESICNRCVTLPCYPELTDEQIDHVTRSITSFLT